MDRNNLLEQIRSAKGIPDSFAFCVAMAQLLSEQESETRPEMLAWFFKMAHEEYGYKKNVQLLEDLSAKLKDYSDKNDKLLEGLIDFYSIKGCSEESYYKSLWDSIETLLPDATSEEKGYCLHEILWHDRTPYYELPDSVKLPHDRFKEVIEDIEYTIHQMDYAVKLSSNQRQKVELTSRVLYLLESLETFEQKSVFLACFWNRLNILWEEEKNENNANSSSQPKNKPVERMGVDEMSQASFTLNSEQNYGDETMLLESIESYQFPLINGDEYSFALVKEGDDVYISDQGKTLEKLDGIFELDEPDVVNNLSAILQQYGVVKQRNEFVIKIDNWNGNANKDENEDINKNVLSLFSCVSFMLNMKIFYE